jgi:hypothetical protein
MILAPFLPREGGSVLTAQTSQEFPHQPGERRHAAAIFARLPALQGAQHRLIESTSGDALSAGRERHAQRDEASATAGRAVDAGGLQGRQVGSYVLRHSLRPLRGSGGNSDI